MKEFFNYFILLGIFFFSSCGSELYDYDEMTERIDGLEHRVDELEKWCAEVNTNLKSLKELADALAQNDMITSVTPVYKDGELIGYTISFIKSDPITIYQGKAGKDGVTPVIGVKKDNDDIYYWTVDGEWLLDEQGNKVKAQGTDGVIGEDGKDGEDGITPQLKIEEDYWFVSYDNGESWEKLEPAMESGTNVFKSVKVEEDQVTFTLIDGSQLVVPIYKEVEITFDTQFSEVGIAGGEVIRIPFKLKNATSNTFIYTSSASKYTAIVESQNTEGGVIVVTAPSVYVDGCINVHIDNGNGYSSLKIVNFYEHKIEFANGLDYVVAAEGATISVPLKTNFKYRVSVPSNVTGWVHLADTRAVDTWEETLTFSFDKNNSVSARTATIDIIPDNAQTPLYQINFTQASATFSIDKSRFAAYAAGATLDATIFSTRGLKVESRADWIVATPSGSGTDFTLKMEVAANNTGAYRTGTVNLYSEDGSILLLSLVVAQISQDNDEKSNMVFECSANPVNDYTVYLPLSGNVDCVIDWGDGTLDAFYLNNQDLWNQRTFACHTYSGLTQATNFTVKVTGKVTSLNANPVPYVYRNSITQIKQWGKTGLRNMNYAFSGYNNIRSIVADDTEAFAEVENFSGCFYGCARITTLFPNLFQYAKKAKYFTETFANCTALESVPGSLFKNCEEVLSFSYLFYGCSSLKTVPGELFAACSKVTSFRYSFDYCIELNSIPENLFANNPLVTDFGGTFYYCRSIESVPEGLFANNPLVENFGALFSGCNNLMRVPVGIFDNNRLVDNFNSTFNGCYNLRGESPYTVINGLKYHLYERVNNPDEFVYPSQTSYCFSGCYNKLDDADNIPQKWYSNF
ncbi:MAG: PL29 family lyase N-terminal domain-containing protein [Bacteroidaceae bacterium]|nr:PL29 family lyase N-terminal domain-containing protein [Bacteroidaceae bacterium]